ncbi:purple acid phosphatase 3-like [Vigna unguiculata]|uniref:Purple acid phosphatase n=1 Tax=Vigna unguiculata TaxID=3917 RepID=A0A4D6LNA1_VIGUN|nr:purple acid phosphatase 3-like [Vigna unguiculata]QCD89504.1 acid phosphatase [Vigna unguiculata]
MGWASPPLHSATILWMYFVLPVFAELQRVQHQPKHDGTLNFLVVGDWGRKGKYNQSLVATQMGKMGDILDLDFVVSTGDNFYKSGIKGLNDPNFVQSFSNIYTAKSLRKQWYSVLGNHDYRGNALAQLSPILRRIDRRWFCQRSFILNAGVADFFFIDTTPFINKYFNTSSRHYDWRGVLPREKYIKNLLKDLEEALVKSSARWKIVVGHHAIRSIGHHGDSVELINHLVPLLKANNVDMYINGHDHCLQHISSINSPLLYLTSGGGSKAWRGDVKESDSDVKFFYDGQGFMSVQITETETKFAFYNAFGDRIHHSRVTKSTMHPVS